MSDLASKIDHTILKAETTAEDIRRICDEAKQFGFAAVCVPPVFVSLAASELDGTEVKVCTVIGFPMGYSDTESKVIEAQVAIDDGAQELDMVIHIGALLGGDDRSVKDDIEAVKQVCKRDGIVLKVILETGLLTNAQIELACDILNDVGVDFAKTSTGFNGGGASVEAVKLLRSKLNSDIRIKASGGIGTTEFAEELIAAGADRIGASKSTDLI